MHRKKFNSISVVNFLEALQQVTQGTASIRKEGEQVSSRATAWT